MVFQAPQIFKLFPGEHVPGPLANCRRLRLRQLGGPGRKHPASTLSTEKEILITTPTSFNPEYAQENRKQKLRFMAPHRLTDVITILLTMALNARDHMRFVYLDKGKGYDKPDRGKTLVRDAGYAELLCQDGGGIADAYWGTAV